MSHEVALVTGAGGEMGRLLLPALAARGQAVVALDRVPLPPELARSAVTTAVLDLGEPAELAELVARFRPARVFHLAAMLSSQAERDPDTAERVNVDATLQLLRAAGGTGRPVRFLFPSSIAVYGLPDAATKAAAGALAEWQWTVPTGVYGCHKLYGELLGAWHARRSAGGLEFRALRFPGLISADSLPSGGTTDYAPEMIHAAARGASYRCFVEPRTRLPFMTMPDAIDAILALAEAEAASLSLTAYNVRGFSASAAELRHEVLRHFPQAALDFAPQAAKQTVVDSWPEDVDDARARRDWGFAPRHGLAPALADYLVPALVRRYAADGAGSRRD